MEKTDFTDEYKRYLYDIIDSIYRDVETMTTGNLVHRKPCLLHDIRAIKSNIEYFFNKEKEK